MKKFCVKCGKQFDAQGREVICPACKAQAAEDAKRAAVLKAKKASWNGESVPVRISGRASTVIRSYGRQHNLPFAAALDALIKDSVFFQDTGKAWEDVTPYKSHRRDKATSTGQDKQDKQDGTQATSKPQDEPVKPVKPVVKPVKQAAKKAVKTSKTNKTSTAGK